MTFTEVLNTATAVLASVGVGGGIVFALSSYLGKVWAARILDSDRAKYAEKLQELAHGFSMRQVEHQVKVSHIQKDRVAAVMDLHAKMADAFSNAWVLVSLSRFAEKVSLLNSWATISSTSSDELWAAVNRSQLYVSDELFQRVLKFHWRVKEIVEELNDMRARMEEIGHEHYRKSAQGYLGEFDRNLRDSRDEIVASFKNVLGTRLD